MRMLLWVVLVIKAAALLYFVALRLSRYRLSQFELRSSFAHKNDKESQMLKSINKHFSEITILRLVDIAVLLILISGLFVYLEQSLVGIVYTVSLMILIWLLAKLKVVQNLASQFFEQHYEFVCQVVVRLKPILKPVAVSSSDSDRLIHSRAELLDIVQTLPSRVLLPVERQRLESILRAEEKTVKSIMTPKKRITTIEPSAILGPVVLSDLQKTGHGYFPVATKKGEPEGVLILSEATDVQLTKGRTAVREVMSSHIAWAEEDASLFELTTLFLKEKQYLMLVRNQEGEFNGLVTIADLMKHLLGIVKD